MLPLNQSGEFFLSPLHVTGIGVPLMTFLRVCVLGLAPGEQKSAPAHPAELVGCEEGQGAAAGGWGLAVVGLSPEQRSLGRGEAAQPSARGWESLAAFHPCGEKALRSRRPAGARIQDVYLEEGARLSQPHRGCRWGQVGCRAMGVGF